MQIGINLGLVLTTLHMILQSPPRMIRMIPENRTRSKARVQMGIVQKRKKEKKKKNENKSELKK